MGSKQVTRLEVLLARAREAWLVPLEAATGGIASTRPRGGGWSAAEIGAHLVLTEEAVTLAFEKLFADPARAPRAAGFRLRRLAVALVPFRAIHARAPKAVTPKSAMPHSEIVRRSTASRLRLLENLRFAGGHRDVAAIVHPHPFFGPLTLFEWARVVVLHERRHARQLVETLASVATEGKP